MSFITDATLPGPKPDRYWHAMPGADHDALRAALLDLRTRVIELSDAMGITTPVWDDLQGRIQLATGSAALQNDPFRDTSYRILCAPHNSNVILSLEYQMPHEWAFTDVKPHIHWVPLADPAAPQVIRWNGAYTWAYPNSAIPAAASWTTFQVDATVSPGDVYEPVVTGLATVAPRASPRVSDILLLYIQRDAASASDTYTTNKDHGTPSANVGLLSLDTHVQRNTNGTVVEYVP